MVLSLRTRILNHFTMIKVSSLHHKATVNFWRDSPLLLLLQDNSILNVKNLLRTLSSPPTFLLLPIQSAEHEFGHEYKHIWKRKMDYCHPPYRRHKILGVNNKRSLELRYLKPGNTVKSDWADMTLIFCLYSKENSLQLAAASKTSVKAPENASGF